ncbi:hypothetical protein AYJ57_17830 [Salipiger sp. CCB-MM3]|uniref:metallophosphoesterase n=1 Tax=Salipiger sp. CCB-MM3 TaxID=1792508 RepID=UPI00080AA180|nr:metallophosphoesterase [Salipiger sp. CCB-MM3]ANT62283.1 hypothetical protein AYJ57_17830 [Salipiger sp. CCB-MM3]
MSKSTKQVEQLSRVIPSRLPPKIEVFAVGDIHGRARALRDTLSAIRAMPKCEGTRRIVVFLGDLIDRGPENLLVLKLVSRASVLMNADEVRLLPGNHELMLLDYLDRVSNVWLFNGGTVMLDELDCDWRSLRWLDVVDAVRAALPDSFETAIRNAPSHLQIGGLLFVHAGLAPHKAPEVHLQKRRVHETDSMHWAWIREPFLNWMRGWTWSVARGEYSWGDSVVVHGHSAAVEASLAVSPGRLSSCDRIDTHRRLCLDAGASTWDQIAWAHFYQTDGRTMMRLAATVGERRSN